MLQVADLAFANFGVPDGAMRFVWIALLAAFPLAFIWAWRYDLTADGIVRTSVAEAVSKADTRLRAPDYAILVAIAAIGITIIAGLVSGTVSYTHLTLPTNIIRCRSRWAPSH